MTFDVQIPEKEILVQQFKDMVQAQIHKNKGPTDLGVYMVTTHLHDPNGPSSIEKKIQYVISSAPIVYQHILNKTVKKHGYKSRKKYHPFMLSFVDFSGSRQNNHQFGQVPHLHSILVVHPDIDPVFKKFCENGFHLDKKRPTTSRFQKMDAREILTQDDLGKVIDYSAKSYFLKSIPFVSKEVQADMMILNGR